MCACIINWQYIFLLLFFVFKGLLNAYIKQHAPSPYGPFITNYEQTNTHTYLLVVGIYLFVLNWIGNKRNCVVALVTLDSYSIITMMMVFDRD